MVYYVCHVCGITTGLNFKLDVGTLRLDQQVACQRYRQNSIDAKSFVAQARENTRAFLAMDLTPSFATV
jgi:hypothetical protein